MKPKIETSKDAAKKAGINLSEDVQNWKDGYTKHTNIKRDWRKCPRCRGKISREHRKCLDCGGKVLFSGDDGAEFNRNMDYWYMWYKNVWGVEGYYAKEYFTDGFASFKY